MNPPNTDWEKRASKLWATFDEYPADEFVAAIDALVSELPHKDTIGMFEQGCAHDSTGNPEQAVQLYEASLKGGVEGIRRRRAVIQMASSLRNLGDPEMAVELLTKELNSPSDELDGAVHAFLALALPDLRREREAIALALTALSKYLPRYNQSLAHYAKAIDDPAT